MSTKPGQLHIRCLRGTAEVGYAIVSFLYAESAARRTGAEIGPLLELELVRVHDEFQPLAEAAQVLFCAVFEIVATLGLLPITGMIIDVPDSDPRYPELRTRGVERLLDRSGLFERMQQPPFFFFARADDLPLVREAYCSETRMVKRLK